MQFSHPIKPQPEPENKCPDCLYIKVEGLPVQPDSQTHLDFWQTSTQTHKIELYLTLKFDEQWETLEQGRVKFGLKGGELRLKLENSEVPYEDRELAGSLELFIQNKKQEQEQEGGEPKVREVGESTLGFGLNGSKTRVQISDRTQPNSAQTARLPVSVCHVTTKVSEENPVWLFEEEKGDPVLKGSLNNAKLATLNVIAFPCRVEATFEVSKRDVCLTDAEGLWPPDISRNKRAVLDRLIIQHLLEPKFKPYLSRAELHYE